MAEFQERVGVFGLGPNWCLSRQFGRELPAILVCLYPSWLARLQVIFFSSLPVL